MAQPQVTVSGAFRNAGLPAQGQVTFSDTSFSVDSVDGTVNTPVTIPTYLDQNGQFFVKLPLNVGPSSTPQPRTYHCAVNVSGTTMEFDFVLQPLVQSLNFSDIVPVGQVPILPPQYVSSIGGLSGVISYNDFVSTFPALAPTAGKSAYRLWLDNGHTGTLDDFFAALRGLQGLAGDRGDVGPDGGPGPRGPRGSVGPSGRGFKVDVIVNAPENLTAGGGSIGTDGQATLFPKDSMAAVLSTHEFWFFDGVQWQNLGSYQGAQGPAGPSATKASIGLGNVDNTADVDKPVSTLQAAAISQVATNAGKVKSVNAQTGDVVLGADDVGLGNVPNFSAAQWPFSDALTSRLTNIDSAITARYTKPAGGTVGKFLQGNDTWKALTSSDVGLAKVRNFESMGELDATTNLDSLAVSAIWFQSRDTAATSALSYPVARAGFLQVFANNSGTRVVVQNYLAYGYGNVTPKLYSRSTYDVQSWTPWRQIYVSGVEDILALSLRVSGGQGLSPSGTASVRSLVFGGGAADSALDGSTTAITYPFAPSASTAWSGFPQGVSVWRLSAGGNGSPTDYPLLTGMLFMHRTATQPRQELIAPTGPNYVRHFVNGAWLAWKPVEQEMATGQVMLNLTANTIASVWIPFPSGRFSVIPAVTATPQTTVPDRVSVSTNGTDTTGFTLWANRTTTSGTTFNWIALAS